MERRGTESPKTARKKVTQTHNTEGQKKLTPSLQKTGQNSSKMRRCGTGLVRTKSRGIEK